MIDLLLTWGVFVVGFLAGWLLLWRPRPLPRVGASPRAPIAVVIPARNEAAALPHLLPALLAGAREDDEIVVVDDHSEDDTATVARSLGARVIEPPALPEGWLGKPHACHHGAAGTTAPTLVFLDADVRPPTDLLDRLGAAVMGHRQALISVQPFHHVERPTEHLSLLFNVVALMGVGRFSVLGARVRPRTAFGPVVAVDRELYERVGGHADISVRSRHTEDIGLARTVGQVELFTGAPDIAFRMYPGGLPDLIRGWTRSLASGATSGPWWAALLTVLWVWSVAVSWMVAWWLYPVSALQVWFLGRRAGRFSPVIAIVHPLALATLILVLARSAVARILGRQITWKSRRVSAR